MASSSTVVWLYQLSSAEWDQDSYRLEVAEGDRIAWPIRSKRSSLEPEPGQRIVCWWAKSGTLEYGVIGWGVVESTTYGTDLRWRAIPPSDRWAMSPITSREIESAVDKVRGKMRQATLFAAEGSLAVELIAAIRAASG